jgi:hypothetical protein
MKPGDLVRVRNLSPVAAVHHGKVGVIVKLRPIWLPSGIAEVLVDGNIRHFYLDYLEPVNETR